MQNFSLPTHSEFASRLNASFKVHNSEGSVEVKLVEVSELKQHERQESFSLLFSGPLNSMLEQGLHDFEHEDLGTFALFIVPVGTEQEAFLYEAVFNKIRNNS
jgi:hypothetical protein